MRFCAKKLRRAPMVQLALRRPVRCRLCGIGEIFYLNAYSNKERLAGGASARGYSIQHGFVAVDHICCVQRPFKPVCVDGCVIPCYSSVVPSRGVAASARSQLLSHAWSGAPAWSWPKHRLQWRTGRQRDVYCMHVSCARLQMQPMLWRSCLCT